jgi:hypothetical protein
MTDSDFKLTNLLADVDKAEADKKRLFEEAIARPKDTALHEQMWDAMDREVLARRAVLRHTGGA